MKFVRYCQAAVAKLVLLSEIHVKRCSTTSSAGCLAVVDVKDPAACSMEMVQAPVSEQAESLMNHRFNLYN